MFWILPVIGRSWAAHGGAHGALMGSHRSWGPLMGSDQHKPQHKPRKNLRKYAQIWFGLFLKAVISTLKTEPKAFAATITVL